MGNTCKNMPLDKVLGKTKIELDFVEAIEDAYVEGGEKANENFGTLNVIEVKGKMNNEDTGLHRRAYVKFDISKIRDVKAYSKYLSINCGSVQTMRGAIAHVNVYSVNPDSWSDKTITYNNAPMGEKLVGTTTMMGKGTLRIDLDDFMKEAAEKGESKVSFCIEETDTGEDARRLIFDSIESGNAPKIEVMLSDISIVTDVVKVKVNPWENAVEIVDDWLERWEKIKLGGDENAIMVVPDKEEYPITVDGCNASETDGANTRYHKFDTRLLSTLREYSYNKSETDLYDCYGGYIGGERYEATGYFYTKKFGDRWQTVDPLGNPFYRVACVETCPGLSDLQKASVLEKSGTVENWAVEATKNLKTMGYNSTGGWSDMEYLSKVDSPLALTRIIGVARMYAHKIGTDVTTGGSVEIAGGIIPSFDPDFADFAKEITKKTTEDYVNAPYVYGWMSDNELPCGANMLDSCLSMDYTSEICVYSYATAWTFMYIKTGKKNVSMLDVTDDLRDEFRAMVYDRYFKCVRDALDEYAPNHQYMGCRFLPDCYMNEAVNRVAGYWCDVISYNYYGAWTPDFRLSFNMQRWAGKPFIVTEWYAKGMDVWEKDHRITNKTGAGFTVRTQADRGKYYQNFVLGLMEWKGCVGFDWFKYWDNDPDNLWDDTSNRDSNKGIYSSKHEEYTELTEYMTELNRNKYSLIEFFDKR